MFLGLVLLGFVLLGFVLRGFVLRGFVLLASRFGDTSGTDRLVRKLFTITPNLTNYQINKGFPAT